MSLTHCDLCGERREGHGEACLNRPLPGQTEFSGANYYQTVCAVCGEAKDPAELLVTCGNCRGAVGVLRAWPGIKCPVPTPGEWESLKRKKYLSGQAASDNSDWFNSLVSDLSKLLNCKAEPSAVIEAVKALQVHLADANKGARINAQVSLLATKAKIEAQKELSTCQLAREQLAEKLAAMRG